MHIGKHIREIFDNAPKRCTATWLAKALNCNRRNVYDIFERPTIDVELLRRISLLLNHDFFADLSAELCQLRDAKDIHEPEQFLTDSNTVESSRGGGVIDLLSIDYILHKRKYA